MMTIQFADDAIDSYIWALNKLRLYTIKLKVKNSDDYKEPLVIAGADDTGLILHFADSDGFPIKETRWTVEYDSIESITIL